MGGGGPEGGRAARGRGGRPLRVSGWLAAGLAVGLAALPACGGGEHGGSRAPATGAASVSDSAARAVLDRHRDSLRILPGVVGTGLGLCEGEPCIKVLVDTLTPELQRRIPERLEGVRVEIVATGPIRALDEDTGGAG